MKPSPVKELVGKFGEAVISIETPSGKGSGFIINKDGYAITNAHVIQGETRVSAILYMNVPGGFTRRRIEDVEIVALNPFFDLALLKLPLPADLKPSHVVLGNDDDVNAGDAVFAVGNPLGLERSVTQGIVSNRSRNLEGQLFLQTDTAINPGQLRRAAVQPARRGDRGDEPRVSRRSSPTTWGLRFRSITSRNSSIIGKRLPSTRPTPTAVIVISTRRAGRIAGQPEGLKDRPSGAKSPVKPADETSGRRRPKEATR